MLRYANSAAEAGSTLYVRVCFPTKRRKYWHWMPNDRNRSERHNGQTRPTPNDHYIHSHAQINNPQKCICSLHLCGTCEHARSNSELPFPVDPTRNTKKGRTRTTHTKPVHKYAFVNLTERAHAHSLRITVVCSIGHPYEKHSHIVASNSVTWDDVHRKVFGTQTMRRAVYVCVLCVCIEMMSDK